jgi:hypothetical protein
VATRSFSVQDLPDCIYISKCCRAALGPAAVADAPIHRHLASGSRTIGVVATLPGYHASHVVGYMFFEPRSGGLVIEDLCTEPYYRRRTVAMHLIKYLRGRLGATVDVPRTYIECICPEWAMDSLCPFLARQGFTAVLQDDGRARRFVARDGSVLMRYDAGPAVGGGGDGTGCEGEGEASNFEVG